MYLNEDILDDILSILHVVGQPEGERINFVFMPFVKLLQGAGIALLTSFAENQVPNFRLFLQTSTPMEVSHRTVRRVRGGERLPEKSGSRKKPDATGASG